MKLKLSVAWLLALLLVGCSTLGVPAADTFNKRVVAANALVEQASATVETLLVAGKISKEEAQQYNQRAKDAAAAIDIARSAQATDPAEADARLSAIMNALNALVAELEKRQ